MPYWIAQAPTNLRKWVLKTRSNHRWREVYLNAGALGMSRCLVKLLLDLDVPAAPASEEAFLAADLCAASTGIEEDVLERLFRQLLPRKAGYAVSVLDRGDWVIPFIIKTCQK